MADGYNLALAIALARDGDDGGLIENDPPPRHINQRIRRAKIDGHVVRDKAQGPREHTPAPIGSKRALNTTENMRATEAGGRAFGSWPSVAHTWYVAANRMDEQCVASGFYKNNSLARTSAGRTVELWRGRRLCPAPTPAN
jgi:hypothetical protein